MALDYQRPVGDDPALRVHGYDEAGALDLDCEVWHFSYLSTVRLSRNWP